MCYTPDRELIPPNEKPKKSQEEIDLEDLIYEYEGILDALKWDNNTNRIMACKRLIKYLENKLKQL